ncbi:uncharacterized protein MYCFIDRAFT_76090 [Pseudocercospora fijiensis CIRAD86]|uniref:U1-C C2H2-type zinc finger domain-containing protein n=1 Tax=Pseudocercospora fijiensis (strain CIRAD86) TaxID=383855 RepID=N1Q6U5_PSEFD|nr:uncharacterized protein MYCFIDRAFT_76090 [Pseudocercospora fijiensis CIRAD86]EME88259.1 hypothetical protein MYCFIDRAFT_76090 [Pseudocercospora fijiensis CIRAD86]
MAEYWKSTPTYWCKFCSQHVRDTKVEKKNHEASAKHQNNIQRSLRELHKGKEREDREKQRAKDEVARLNGMFGGTKSSPNAPVPATTSQSRTQPPTLNIAQQRKAHAEQLAALGVELPDELTKEVTGIGSYRVVQEREVEDRGSISNLLKRKIEENEDPRDEEATPRQKKAWGSNIKSYPGKKDDDADIGDLDALLSGVKKKESKAEGDIQVKTEPNGEVGKALDSLPDVEGAGAATTVVFKKRKGKK